MRYIQKNHVSINKWLYLHKDKSKSYNEDIKNERLEGKKNNYDNILEDLLEEQGFLCAYCMRSIKSKNATIEHFIGQVTSKREDTNYQNMLAVCLGNFCKKLNKNKEKLHCDSSRSNFQKKYKDKEAEEKNQVSPTYRPYLHISPLNRQQMNNIKFSQSGVIYYENIDDESEISFDLNKVLNLNCENIKEKRKRIINMVKSLLGKYKFDKKFAKKQLEYWESRNGSYKEYSQVAIFELRKHI